MKISFMLPIRYVYCFSLHVSKWALNHVLLTTTTVSGIHCSFEKPHFLFSFNCDISCLYKISFGQSVYYIKKYPVLSTAQNFVFCYVLFLEQTSQFKIV
jgi:hypothetical protein